MIVMVVLLIVVSAVFFYSRLTTTDTRPSTPEDAIRPRTPGNAPPAARPDPALLTGVRDSTSAEQAIRENEPFVHLMREAGKLVAGDFSRLDTQDLDDEAVLLQLLADPAAARGQPFSARGLFSFVEEKSIDIVLDGVGGAVTGTLTYYQGMVQDMSGHSYSFSVLEEPENIEPGQIVRIRGFFFKRFALFDPADPDRLIEDTVHLVGKRIVRSFLRMDPVSEISPALMATIRDYELEDQLRIPEEPLFHTLSYVMNVDADELSAQATDYTSFTLRTNPQEHRGQAVRVLGTFFESWPQHLGVTGENPLDLPEVWHGLLVHGGPSFTFMILPEREPEWAKNGTTVIAEGIFLKRYAYQARNGEAVSAPLIVVKRFIRYEVNADAVNTMLMSVVCIVIALALFGWFLMSVFGDRKANVRFRKRYYERRRESVKNLATRLREEPK